jgi:hypothetical protein
VHTATLTPRSLAPMLLSAAVLVAGCAPAGSATETPSSGQSRSPAATATPEVTSTTRPSPSPDASATPLPDPTYFESVVYPYTLTLPEGVPRRYWAAATRQWDGQELVGSQTPKITDVQSTPDGSLFIYGTAWDGTLEAFRDHVLAIVARYHRCEPPEEEVTFDVADAPAIAFRQRCDLGTRAAPAVAVQNGFGMVFRLIDVPAEKESVVLADLETWLHGLTWTN